MSALRAVVLATTAGTALAVLTGCAGTIGTTTTGAGSTASPTTVSPELARVAVCTRTWDRVLDAAYATQPQPSLDYESSFAAAASKTTRLILDGVNQDEFRAMDRLVFAGWRHQYQGASVSVDRGQLPLDDGLAILAKLHTETRLKLGPACALATIPVPPVEDTPTAPRNDLWPTGQATALPEPGTAPENVNTCEQIVYYYAPFLLKDANSAIDHLMKNSYGGTAYGGLEESLRRAATNPLLRTNPKAVAKQACTL